MELKQILKDMHSTNDNASHVHNKQVYTRISAYVFLHIVKLGTSQIPKLLKLSHTYALFNVLCYKLL